MLKHAYSRLHRQKSTRLVHLMLTTAFTSDEGSHHMGYRTSPQRQHVSGTTKMRFVISASHTRLSKGKDSPDPAYTATCGDGELLPGGTCRKCLVTHFPLWNLNKKIKSGD